MARCKLRGRASAFISKGLGLCLPCIRKEPEKALPIAREAHRKSRAAFGLPREPGAHHTRRTSFPVGWN